MKAMTKPTTVMSLTGNEAAAWALRCARVKVGLSFPLGPNAEVMETAQRFIDRGEVNDLQILFGDTEKNTASMQIGVARLGVRSMLVINSDGMMWATAELHYSASDRLPVILVCPSRSLEPPTSLSTDHDDVITMRDHGWLIFYCEDSQDIFDTIIQAYKVIENESVMLPAIVGFDGYEGTSHASGRVVVPDQGDIDKFLPPPNFVKPERDYFTVDWKDTFSHRRRMKSLPDQTFMEVKYHQKMAELNAANLIEKIGKEFAETFSSHHVGLIESHECEDADIILIAMGIIYSDVKFVVDSLREEGVKVGCIKLRVFHPFPAKALCEKVKGAKLVITLDRNTPGAINSELKSALYSYLVNEGKGKTVTPLVMGKVVGIARVLHLKEIGSIIEDGLRALELGKMERDFDWFPMHGIKYDPSREVLGE
ncbi:transketolase C-terminal domain-containing protein [Chloroflexota bacterium]